MTNENEKKRSLEDEYLDRLKAERAECTIFLINGVKLRGIVKGHDAYCVIISHNNLKQLLYKHGIACIHPDRPGTTHKSRDIYKTGGYGRYE